MASRTVPTVIASLLAAYTLGIAGCEKKGDVKTPDTVAPVTPVKDECQYVVAFNAGMTETRVHVYLLDERESGVPETAKEVMTKAVKPGLSAYLKRPDDGVELIKPLVEGPGGVLAKVPAICHEKTPTVFMGSAGMRMVVEASGEDSDDDLYNAITNYLEASDLQITYIGTITGEDQALYGWIAVNYLLGTLIEGATSGSLDLGTYGAQIAYKPDKNVVASDTVPVLFGGLQHMVYVKSYLGYGAERAREEYAPKACYPKGFEGGKGDYGACRERLASVLKPESCDRVTCSAAKPGSKAGEYQPPLPIDTEFHAIGHYPRVREDLKLEETATPAEIATAGEGLCATPWDQLIGGGATPADGQETGAETTAPPAQTLSQAELKGYCFESAWAPAMVKQLGFRDNIRSIHWTDEFGDKGVPASWVLGAAVCHSVLCK